MSTKADQLHSSPGVTGNLVLVDDGVVGAGAPPGTIRDACEPLVNAAAVLGNIAVMDRGFCGFAVKVKIAQNTGATAAIVVNNVAGSPTTMGGADPTITIPSVMVSLADGNALKAAMAGGPVNGNVGVNLAVLAGADPGGRALVFAPNPVQGGSSISHWDGIAFRNQLMEPAINPDLTHSVQVPEDLTTSLMRDIGWFPDADLDGVPDDIDCKPNSNFDATVEIGDCDSGVPNTFFASGCTINDLIQNIADGARNHGQFVKGVKDLLKSLEDQRLITKKQSKAIHKCVSKKKLDDDDGAISSADLPDRLALRFAGSNPARGGTNLELWLPSGAEVELRVFDVRGALVWHAPAQEFAPGRHVIRWDGRASDGHSAVAGVYFVQAVSAAGTENLRFVLLR